MKKVLIANRGEIAVRLIRGCRDYGAASVAVYADDDVDAPFVRLADEAFGLGGTQARDTYLDLEKLIAVARRAGADAVHPGYGFLSERADFAQAVLDAGLIWIGPPPGVIAQLGDKVQARALAQSVGAPLVAGSRGALSTPDEALSFARRFGVPVAIKAALGGGGRGLKIARRLDQVEEMFLSATREAEAAFGKGDCYVERFIDHPRHIEAQILADQQGTVLVVGTRDCSLQRRNQKLVEEAPAPFLSDAQRHAIETGARDICKAAGYVSAGTVEFLLGDGGEISFLEVNTRLQVEHPVTEETTGLDLVIEQLRIADGLPLSVRDMPSPRGHAFEFRITVEDPARGFLPSAGRIVRFVPPAGPGVRLDAGVESGSVVPTAFDSLVAKLIVWGADRDQALVRARRALDEFRIDGVPTVLPFHRAVIAHADFTDDPMRVHTRWIETVFDADMPDTPRPPVVSDSGLIRGEVELDGRMVRLGLPTAFLSLFGAVSADATGRPVPTEPADAGAVLAPMTGTLLQWSVADGDRVTAGQTIAVMEAMKMESPLSAPCDGVIGDMRPSGDTVAAGVVLARITRC